VCVGTALIATASGAQPVSIAWSTVGNSGNTADPASGYGAVGYEYRIGTFEVTNAQYTAFLNAVAASDPNELYNTNMGTDPRGGIIRTGSNGSYAYSVKSNMGNKPVNYVSWYDAARMCNWMTSGQGSGGTETGVYSLTGATSIATITRDLSNPSQVFIPSENEWYKAAFHQPASLGGDDDDYWLYATMSNTDPVVAVASITGDVANPGQEVVNYGNAADWNGQNGNVTTVGSAGNTSHYGSFDMNGNIWEWNETLIDAARGLRGGSFNLSEVGLRSSNRNFSSPSNETSFIGFRLAAPIPTPHCPPDTNSDGLLTPADFSAWIAAFNAMSTACDQNGDNACTPADFSAWIANYNAGC